MKDGARVLSRMVVNVLVTTFVVEEEDDTVGRFFLLLVSCFCCCCCRRRTCFLYRSRYLVSPDNLPAAANSKYRSSFENTAQFVQIEFVRTCLSFKNGFRFGSMQIPRQPKCVSKLYVLEFVLPS